MAEPSQPATVEELTVTREGDDRMAPRRELNKKVLTKGAWATVVYLYEEKNKKTEEWSKPKLSLVRYRKLKGSYRFQKEFALSNIDHALVLRDTIDEWLGQPAEGGDDAEPAAEAEPEKK